MRRLVFSITTAFLLLAFFTKTAQAQTVFDGPPVKKVSIFCDGSSTQIRTAIGCVPALDSSQALIGFILNWAIGIASGVAFLLILFSGFQIMTSSGDPQRLKAGQELLTAAISGLILLVFSVFILRLIGVQILGL